MTRDNVTFVTLVGSACGVFSALHNTQTPPTPLSPGQQVAWRNRSSRRYNTLQTPENSPLSNLKLLGVSDGNSPQSHAESQVCRVSYLKSDPCVPSRCNSLSRRAACGVANGRCGGPGCHDLATSSPLDGTESGGCGSICGTLANRGANERDASIQHAKTPSSTDSGKAAKHC